jgi:cell division protein FtsB
MKKILRHLILYGMGLEIFIFSWAYISGPQGMTVIKQMEQKNKKSAEKIAMLKDELSQLTDEITAWQKNPFYKEKMAREQLQLARPDEHIYFVS